jgi:hypothetical protein
MSRTPIRLPRRQMGRKEYPIMWEFLKKVWIPTYPQKYRNNGTLDMWIKKGGVFADLVNEFDDVMSGKVEMSGQHTYILNTLIPRWKADGREEFMKLYKEYKNQFYE